MVERLDFVRNQLFESHQMIHVVDENIDLRREEDQVK
jgi:hypothetical protein